MIERLIEEGKKYLNQHEIQDAGMIVRILLSHILQIKKEQLIIYQEEITTQEQEKYRQALKEIIEGKPLQYIINHQEFMGLEFYVDENVLIPQPDTEILVEETLHEIKNKIEAKLKDSNTKKIKEEKFTIKILDLCTGSGAIAVSLAKYLQDIINKIENQVTIETKIYATDITTKAIEIAKKNAKFHKAEINFIESDLFQNITEKFDVIVSNPPYIETDCIKKLSKQVQNEPYIALDGGKDGLDFYRMIINESNKYLNENGTILLEIGYNQKDSVIQLLKENKNYESIEAVQDLSRNDRVIKAKLQ